MKQKPLVEICGLTRDYASSNLLGRKTAQRALDNVSLDILPAEIFGIVGESGCGKSTLSRLVMALDRPTSGDVLFDGEPLFELSSSALKRKRADFQMVFQDPFGSLDPRMTVGRIIAEPLHLLPKALSRAEKSEQVALMLESVGLKADAAERYPHQFSGGQRQRIAIARALITKPKLVVADEAVSALDLSVQAQVLNLLLDLRDKSGVTFLFVSHNLAVVNCIADRVGVMYLGRLVETGPSQQLFDAPLHPYTRLLIDAEPRIDRMRPETRKALLPSPLAGGKGCAFAPRCPRASDLCRSVRPELISAGDQRAVACHHPLPAL
jgi:oligopeptide/dipeptide ABC transporter ATP-binding protein